VIEKLRPSKEIWNYFKGDITALRITSSIADLIAGYGISYSAMELLKDMHLVSNKMRPNKQAKVILLAYLHEKFHRDRSGVIIVSPLGLEESEKE
jgi:hypothetical protein